MRLSMPRKAEWTLACKFDEKMTCPAAQVKERPIEFMAHGKLCRSYDTGPGRQRASSELLKWVIVSGVGVAHARLYERRAPHCYMIPCKQMPLTFELLLPPLHT